MNIFSFTGRLGRDADMRYTTGGTPVASFIVANDIGFGERKKTQWIKCAMWGKSAESGVISHLTKGREVAITGEVALDEYTLKDGTNKASLSVRVIDLTLVGGKNTAAAANKEEDALEKSRELWKPIINGRNNGFEDELPF